MLCGGQVEYLVEQHDGKFHLGMKIIGVSSFIQSLGGLVLIIYFTFDKRNNNPENPPLTTEKLNSRESECTGGKQTLPLHHPAPSQHHVVNVFALKSSHLSCLMEVKLH